MTLHTKENFARYLGPGKIIRRRDLTVRVAHTATGRARKSSQQTTNPAALPSLKLRRASIAESKRRFDICRTCEHSRDNAFACNLYPGCCFGKFRSNTNNRCLDGHW